LIIQAVPLAHVTCGQLVTPIITVLLDIELTVLCDGVLFVLAVVTCANDTAWIVNFLTIY